ncbi:ABC transporter substrate-binding protein [Pseudovibrio sp. Tun.PSC04-5.I4]|uniref:ABC transporter substrate-binding protein n=1 Tax=Pseudovibrio sp. Tun.PSC04-5.I4 TaxID=1798213 RepID=UPI000890B5AA|nr:ABC transporter substrate-binding protein [Pseudovibrio sp. Tun.PSC04-5.I4]SDQ12813.1 peptide/nickel transport system substrate-binding protein [Pseudovibrio sp. Tun.PSC04-5.I4]
MNKIKQLLSASSILAVSLPVLAAGVTSASAEDIQNLRIAVKKDRYSVDAKKFNFTTRRPAAQIVETAVKPDENFKPQGLLFETWDYKDGVYNIKLREGIKFHDGQTFDAKTAIDALKLYDQGRSDFLQIDQNSFSQTEAYEFSFKSEINSSLVIENMTHRGASLFSLNGDRAENPIGTGPYLLDEYKPKQSISLKRNDAYWGEKPKVENISYHFVPDDQVRLLALQNNEVDIVAEVTPQMLLSLPKDGSVVIHQSRPIRYVALLTNLHGKAPYDKLKDLRVRQALAYAINREQLAEVLFDGKGVVAKGILPDWMFGLGDDHVDGFDYNIQKASALLDEAGWTKGSDGMRSKDGEPLKLRLVAAYPNVSSVRPMPELLEQMFRNIGIEIDLVQVDDSGVYDDTYLATGEADLYMEFASNNNTDPTYLLYNLFHSKTPWGYQYTAPGGALDTILDKARQGQNREEVIELVREAHREIVQTQLAAIPILMVPNFNLSRPGLNIPMFEHADWIDYGQVTQTK